MRVIILGICVMLLSGCGFTEEHSEYKTCEVSRVEYISSQYSRITVLYFIDGSTVVLRGYHSVPSKVVTIMQRHCINKSHHKHLYIKDGGENNNGH